MTNNLDFLAARLHGRRSQMAEGERLEALCRMRSLREVVFNVLPGEDTDSAMEFQRRLLQELAGEIAGIATQLSSTGADLLSWLAARFEIENLKLILRGLMTGMRLDAVQPHLLPLPRGFALHGKALASARTVAEFAHLLPRGALRESLKEAIALYGQESRPFFFEEALDRGYFEELLARAEALTGEDKQLVRPLVLQEVDSYHLMLVARGKYSYGLPEKALVPLHVSGTGLPRERFKAMLTDPDLRTAARRALGRALDVLPGTPGEGGDTSSTIAPAEIERLAWNRFLRLAKQAFRRSHMGLAAVVAFVEMRRVEVANLITLSEGLRAQLSSEQVLARLFPPQRLEAAHV